MGILRFRIMFALRFGLWKFSRKWCVLRVVQWGVTYGALLKNPYSRDIFVYWIIGDEFAQTPSHTQVGEKTITQELREMVV